MTEISEGLRLRRTILRRQRTRVAWSSILLMGHQSCEVMVPVAIGLAIDAAVAGGSLTMLVMSVVGLTLLFLALTMCYRWFARLSEGAVVDESHRLRVEIGARALGAVPLRRQHGELLTIASSDADQAARSIIWLCGLVGSGAALMLSCVVLLSIDVLLGAVLIVTAVAGTFALNALSPLISRRVADQQETLAQASAMATDAVTGLRVLHGLGAQAEVAERYRRVSRAVEFAGIRAGTAKSIQRGATVLIGAIVLVVSTGFAGVLALEGLITVGAFIAAVGVAQFISEPLGAIGFHLQTGAAAKTSASRVHSVLAESPAAERSATEAAREPPSGDENAPDSSPLIHVVPGELLGIVVEHSGVEDVLRRIEIPQEPEIHQEIHIEPHRPDLFAGTVHANLTLGRPDGDVGPALTAAGAREFIESRPAGVQEHVRDRGLSLSGGQRQRLTLARALHTDARALVLIEPTSAVDAVTEEAIVAGIRTLRHGADGPQRTTVILTGSPVLLAASDRVLLMPADGPVTTGTHSELLAGDPTYREKVLR